MRPRLSEQETGAAPSYHDALDDEGLDLFQVSYHDALDDAEMVQGNALVGLQEEGFERAAVVGVGLHSCRETTVVSVTSAPWRQRGVTNPL